MFFLDLRIVVIEVKSQLFYAAVTIDFLYHKISHSRFLEISYLLKVTKKGKHKTAVNGVSSSTTLFDCLFRM